ncbi:hypothetical protein KKI24_04130 [bacterium]|nr:hypothetical protein [bacterium]
MTGKRWFTDEELQDLTKSGLEQMLEAVMTGDVENAAETIKRVHREYQGTHDLYRDWITALLSFIGQRFGDETLEEAYRETFTPVLKPLMSRLLEQGPSRETIEGIASALRGHLGAYAKIEEDQEKFTFHMPCPSGGALVTEGRYDPPYSFLKVKNPQPMTYGRADFPVYCVHCAFQDSLPMDWFGQPLWLMEPAGEIGKEPCLRYVYKKAEDIPARFYEILGKKKI